MADLDAFREDTRHWLEENAPASLRGFTFASESGGNWGGRRASYDPPELQSWLERAAERGFTAPSWPR